jgi:cell division protein FtsW
VPVRDWNGATSRPRQAARLRPAAGLGGGALLALGLVMVYSASVAMPDNPKFTRYTPTHFLTRHAVSIGLAFVAAWWWCRFPSACGSVRAVAVRLAHWCCWCWC